jgi:hypothetical protein
VKTVLESTRRSLAEVSGERDYEYVWNARGYATMLEHARAVMRRTERHLVLAIWSAEAAALEETVKELAARGAQITTLCLNTCPPQGCGFCRGDIYRDAFVPARPVRWLVVISDDAELLVSEIGADDEALTIRTRQSLFIDLACSNMRNSIALAAVVSDLGKGLSAALKPETRQTLGAIAPDGWNADWLEQMPARQEERAKTLDHIRKP